MAGLSTSIALRATTKYAVVVFGVPASSYRHMLACFINSRSSAAGLKRVIWLVSAHVRGCSALTVTARIKAHAPPVERAHICAHMLYPISRRVYIHAVKGAWGPSAGNVCEHGIGHDEDSVLMAAPSGHAASKNSPLYSTCFTSVISSLSLILSPCVSSAYCSERSRQR